MKNDNTKDKVKKENKINFMVRSVSSSGSISLGRGNICNGCVLHVYYE